MVCHAKAPRRSVKEELHHRRGAERWHESERVGPHQQTNRGRLCVG